MTRPFTVREPGDPRYQQPDCTCPAAWQVQSPCGCRYRHPADDHGLRRPLSRRHSGGAWHGASQLHDEGKLAV